MTGSQTRAINADSVGQAQPSRRAQDEPNSSSLPRRNAASSLSIFAQAIFLLLPMFICFQYINTFVVNVPSSDHWTFLTRMSQWQNGTASLWQIAGAQGNEHKAFVNMLLMMWLSKLTAHNMFSLMHWEFALLLAEFGLLSLIAWPVVKKTGFPLLCLTPIAWCIFSVRQWEALLVYVNAMVSLFFTACLAMLHQSRKVDVFFAVAIFTAVLTSYSFGNGLLVWPLGFLLIAAQNFTERKPSDSKQSDSRGFRLSASWLRLLLWCIAGGATIVSYFWHLQLGSHAEDHLSLQIIKHHFWTVAQYALACLGSPLSSQPDGAVAAGILCIVLFAGAVCMYMQNREKNMLAITASMFFLFSVGSALAVMSMRFGGGLDAALQSRYCVYSELGVVGLYLMLLSQLSSQSMFRSLSLGFLIGAMALGNITVVQAAIEQGDRMRSSHMVLANMVRHPELQSDEALTTWADIEPALLVRKMTAYLKDNNLSLFRDPAPPKVAQLEPTQEAPCFLLEYINSLPVHTYPLQRHAVVDRSKEKTLDFRGWAFSFPSHSPCAGAFVNIDGVLDVPTAFGLARPDVAFQRNSGRFLYSGFEGTCRTDLLAPGVHTVGLKVVLPDRKHYFLARPLATLEIR